MPIYHFSEEADIREFVPRPPLAHPETEALVWAIDEWSSPIYFFPRDCPRVTFWPTASTTEQDLRTYWPDPSTRIVTAIEHGWLERFLCAQVYRYRMPNDCFEPHENYGAYVSRTTVTPLDVEPVGSLAQALAEHSTELRVMPSLRALGHQLIETSFHWSFIRMRNAIDWDR